MVYKNKKVVFTCWACDVGGGNVGANNFQNKTLNVLICDSFDVPISDLKFNNQTGVTVKLFSYLFVPDLQRLGPNAVED